jgi:DNA repair ATPase RecN
MKSYIKYIGIVDKNNKVHSVEFTKGVNVITGKSSTGKSAMIEIFDYCMGSSEFNIPSGIITDRTDIFFVVLSVKEVFLVLGRREGGRKIFLKEESQAPNTNTINKEYFEDKYFISDFNVNLGHYFGLEINDVDEDKNILQYTGQKKGRPSIRNIIPYLLQHQNLIANKHSLFYRFDQKEKREQTIDQFKIFAGFVTQKYYMLKQNLAESERTLKKFENEQKSIEQQKEFNAKRLDTLLQEYEAISGNKLFEENSKVILSNVANYIDKLIAKDILIDENSDKSIQNLLSLQAELNILFAEKRKLIYKFKNIDASTAYAKQYKEELQPSSDEIEATLQSSKCPFCQEESNTISDEANQLEEAINWLNSL